MSAAASLEEPGVNHLAEWAGHYRKGIMEAELPTLIPGLRSEGCGMAGQIQVSCSKMMVVLTFVFPLTFSANQHCKVVLDINFAICKIHAKQFDQNDPIMDGIFERCRNLYNP